MRRLTWTLTAVLLAAPSLRADDPPPAAATGAGTNSDEPEAAESAEELDDSRLLLAPTGRPLRKGTGYFSDHYLVFPGFSYGLTDNISVSAGVSTIPGLGLGQQLFYVSPKIGKRFSERLALSAGLLYVKVPQIEGEHESLGLGYVVGSVGGRNGSLSAGVGVFRTTRYEELYGPHYEYLGSETRAVHTPVVMLGGEKRLARNVALISENWLVLDEDFNLGHQPLGLGVRLWGESLSADLGVVLIPAALDEGYPLPWVSVSYHFGQPRKR